MFACILRVSVYMQDSMFLGSMFGHFDLAGLAIRLLFGIVSYASGQIEEWGQVWFFQFPRFVEGEQLKELGSLGFYNLESSDSHCSTEAYLYEAVSGVLSMWLPVDAHSMQFSFNPSCC